VGIKLRIDYIYFIENNSYTEYEK